MAYFSLIFPLFRSFNGLQLLIYQISILMPKIDFMSVLAAHLISIVRVIAPILPHLAKDVWQNLPFEYTTEDGSIAKFVFESGWPALNQFVGKYS
ncbi:hypothetical protein ACSBR2_010578 [Camellia fascicularis]